MRPFARIGAVAFTTVLGTVSGLVLAGAGAVSRDVGTHELVIAFQGMNVSDLVGWAFSVAAGANLPTLVSVLFRKGATKQGVIAGMTVSMVSTMTWILLSSDTFDEVLGLNLADALMPFTQPGIVTIPLGFAAPIVASLPTRRRSGAERGRTVLRRCPGRCVRPCRR